MALSRCANTAGPRKTKAGWRRAGRCAGRAGAGMVVRDTMSVVRRPGAGAGAPGRRSGVMVHHGTGCGGHVSYLPVQPGHIVLVPPPPRTLHRGVGKKSFQHRMTEPIICRDSFSNNYYWSSLVRHYMKCGIKYFSLVKIFSGHTAPVRWWVPR